MKPVPEGVRYVDVLLPVASGPFTYGLVAGAPGLRPGTRVEVPFRNRKASGIVIASAGEVPPEIRKRIRPVESVDDDPRPFVPESFLELIRWVSGYYQCSPGAVLRAAIPSGVWKGTRPRSAVISSDAAGTGVKPPALNAEQTAALETVLSGKPNVTVLFGVTGSGKTEVYLRAVSSLEPGRQALVLVPEIALTRQMVDRFRARFGEELEVFHSGLSMGQRARAWRHARGGACRVVLGVRSAIFLPFEDLGLLVVDEEHASTYKQGEGLKYNARDLAVVRGRLEKAAVVLGSATPSVESFHNALSGRYGLAKLTRRVQNRPMPAVVTVDLKVADRTSGSLSRQLTDAISKTTEAGGQVLLLVNRRGFAPVALCEDCGHSRKCPLCRISLTYHKRDRAFKCHHCGSVMRAADLCPECGGEKTVFLGPGTERAEEEIAEAFPGLSTRRMDLDTTRRQNAHGEILRAMETGEARLVLGTQMVAKGHDLPGVVLAGVISADVLLGLPDFRSAEKAFQLFAQLAGRAGRGEEPGRVAIQTRVPEHYVFDYVKKHDYEGFYRQEIEQRRELGYPPFSRLTRILFSARRKAVFEERLVEILAICRNFRFRGVSLLGPSPCPLEHLRGRFRWHLLLKSRSPGSLHSAASVLLQEIGALADIEVEIDVDPLSMM